VAAISRPRSADRRHLTDSIDEMTLLCNEAARRRRLDPTPSESSSWEFAPPPSASSTSSIKTDDPLWGLMVRTDAPTKALTVTSGTLAKRWRGDVILVVKERAKTSN
jgi:hypothetical protein